MTKIVLLALVALTAACTPGAAPRATPAALPTAQVPTAVPTAATPSAASTASPTPSPVATAALAAPPVATLTGGGVGAQPGELGSVIWNGLTSDTPWVVTPSGPAVKPGMALTVATGGAAPDRWAASWAPVSGNQAGQPRDGGAGQGGTPIKLNAPATAGSWSLRVEAWFGAYNSATWYWRLEVRP